MGTQDEWTPVPAFGLVLDRRNDPGAAHKRIGNRIQIAKEA